MEREIDFKLICDNINSTIFLADKDGNTIYVNKAYIEQTGLSEEKLIGKSIYDLQTENIFRCDIIPQILKDGKPRNAIGYVAESDYRGFVAGMPIYDNAGKLKYVMTTDWDVNQISRIQSYLDSLKGDKIYQDNLYNEKLNQQRRNTGEKLLFVSQKMQEVVDLLHIVAKTDGAVLITGETGTGKEVMASELMNQSNRCGKPYIKINCAAIPDNLIESELFGYSEGAFTGAIKGGKKGAFEEADGGTILLDEIGELPYHVQAKLLRVLQEGEVIRVGSNNPISIDVRVIAATNRNLLQEIQEGRFREDLYYRLNVIQLKIPSLKERKEDIAHIAVRFLSEFREKYHKNVNLDSNVIPILSKYKWPGNIRQLRNTMERLVITCMTELITGEDVNALLGIQEAQNINMTLKDAVNQFEKEIMINAIEEYGSKLKAAEKLGVERTTFVKKCKRYGI